MPKSSTKRKSSRRPSTSRAPGARKKTTRAKPTAKAARSRRPAARKARPAPAKAARARRAMAKPRRAAKPKAPATRPRAAAPKPAPARRPRPRTAPTIERQRRVLTEEVPPAAPSPERAMPKVSGEGGLTGEDADARWRTTFDTGRAEPDEGGEHDEEDVGRLTFDDEEQ